MMTMRHWLPCLLGLLVSAAAHAQREPASAGGAPEASVVPARPSSVPRASPDTERTVAPTPGTARPITAAPTPTLPRPGPSPPVGPSPRAEPSELVFLDATLAQAQQQQTVLQADGLRFLRRQVLNGVGGVLSVYLAPDEERYRRWSTPPADGVPNNLYGLQAADASPVARSRRLTAWPPIDARCRHRVRIGLIDTPVDTTHPLLLGAHIETVNLLPAGQPSADSDHGTAVASILVGQRDTPALLPHATLLAVAVVRQRSGTAETTAGLLIRAIDNLVLARAAVINISIGGPANRWLSQVLAATHAQGIPIVAAAGNGGPKAPPLYPAADDPVVAVTSLDLLGRIGPQAQRGRYIDLAAPGVDIPVAGPDGGLVYRSGSSFAAPFVTAMLASGIGPEALQAGARDLGQPGRDDTFGWGLAQASAGCAGETDASILR